MKIRHPLIFSFYQTWWTLSHAPRMFKNITTNIDRLSDTLITFASHCKDQRCSWDAVVSVHDYEKSKVPVAMIEFQVDKSHKNRLTIMVIEVDSSFERQGIGRSCIQALKTSSVAIGRVAHVQSVMSYPMTNLLLSEDFFPVDGGYCFAWEPLSLKSWIVDTSLFLENTFHPLDREVYDYVGSVSQLVDIWEEAIPGMELFSQHAKWFKPETDLEKISLELEIPESTLEEYRVDKGCFAMSSLFSEKYTTYYVIEGLAIDPSIGPLALEHACLCRIKKGQIYVFDLVRRTPLYVYGTVMRMDMKRNMNELCKDTWAGYSVINGLNYVKNKESFWA